MGKENYNKFFLSEKIYSYIEEGIYLTLRLIFAARWIFATKFLLIE